MKEQTVKELLNDAEIIKQSKLDQNYYDEVEIAYIPVVISKKDGRVASVSGIDWAIITSNENNDNIK